MDMATHNISYCVVLASALEKMCAGPTMRTLETATDRGITCSHMIESVCICGGSY